MICCCKSITSNFYSIVVRQRFLIQQIRTKSNRACIIGDSDKDEDDDNDNHGHENNNFGQDFKSPAGQIRLLKSRGQHLLTNPRVLDAIIRKSDVKPTDTVLEIGPGTGNLTLKLLEAAKNVIAIEIDKRMVEILHKRVAERGFEDRLTIIQNDALKAEFPPFDLVVANIPFGISSPLVAKFLFGGSKFRNATLLIQKEFARRILTDPGESEYNRLAANVKLVADVEFVMDVSKRDFVPVPKVDSSVVKIHPKENFPLVHKDFDLHEWWAFTRVCFRKKNKTLGATFKKKRLLTELMNLSENDLKPETFETSGEGEDTELADEHEGKSESDLPLGLNSFRKKVEDILVSGGCDGKRPAKLSNEELVCLLSLFNQAGIHFFNQSQVKDAADAAFEAAYDPM